MKNLIFRKLGCIGNGIERRITKRNQGLDFHIDSNDSLNDIFEFNSYGNSYSLSLYDSFVKNVYI